MVQYKNKRNKYKKNELLENNSEQSISSKKEITGKQL